MYCEKLYTFFKTSFTSFTNYANELETKDNHRTYNCVSWKVLRFFLCFFLTVIDINTIKKGQLQLSSKGSVLVTRCLCSDPKTAREPLLHP